MLTFLKSTLALAVMTAATLATTGIYQPVSAKTLVTCGPKGAAFIVDVVPAGCRVLSAGSPPKQAGNPVEKSALGFYFRASVPQPLRSSTPIAALPPTMIVR